MKYLVIAEKHSVAKSIANALGKPKYRKDAARMPLYEVKYKGDTYVVTYAQGHLYTLAIPSAYDEAYKKWDMSHLPIIPSKYKLEPIKVASKRIKAIKDILKKEKFDAVINATDAGREGELIFAYIKDKLGIKLPIKRLWLQAMTPAAIRQAFDNLIDGSQMKNLEASARARAIADWLIGINGTRGLTIAVNQYGNVFSIGRVQTPTLKIVVDRELEIKNFKPEKFFRFDVDIDVTDAINSKKKPQDAVYVKGSFVLHPDLKASDPWRYRIKESEQPPAELLALVGKTIPLTVSSVKRTKKTAKPNTVFKLSTFQTAASSIYGWTAQKSLSVLQSLYEEGYISYPRTDSDYLPTAMKKEVQQLINTYATVFSVPLSFIDTQNISKNKVFNDKKISDHYGLVPTDKKPNLNDLTADQKKAYELIVRRFLAVFAKPAEYTIHKVVYDTTIKNKVWQVEASYITYQYWGYLMAYPYDLRNVNNAPFMKVENYDKLDVLALPIQENKGDKRQGEVDKHEGQTSPPPRYSDGTLIKAMEHAGRFIDDKEMQDYLEEKGIGTPATRAAIIETLIQRGYIARKGKQLVATEKGIKLIETLQNLGIDFLTSPLLTAEWESKLLQIEEGKYQADKFLKGIEQETQKLIDTIRNRSAKIKDALYNTNYQKKSGSYKKKRSYKRKSTAKKSKYTKSKKTYRRRKKR